MQQQGKLKEDSINFFQDREEVLWVYLFGSCLWGKIGKNHDYQRSSLLKKEEWQ
jgi:hypothetical protein